MTDTKDIGEDESCEILCRFLLSHCVCIHLSSHSPVSLSRLLSVCVSIHVSIFLSLSLWPHLYNACHCCRIRDVRSYTGKPPRTHRTLRMKWHEMMMMMMISSWGPCRMNTAIPATYLPLTTHDSYVYIQLYCTYSFFPLPVPLPTIHLSIKEGQD